MKKNFNVLTRKTTWDKNTQRIIEERMLVIPEIKFFNLEEIILLQSIIKRIFPELEKNDIPLVNHLDKEVFEEKSKGYRYSFQPTPKYFWKLFLTAVEDTALEKFDKKFFDLLPDQQDIVLRSVQGGEVKVEEWRKHSKVFFNEALNQLVGIYYSFPQAWNEIGWAGPIYPHSYYVLSCGQEEPWEPEEENDKI